jgi:hypothetical protein
VTPDPNVPAADPNVPIAGQEVDTEEALFIAEPSGFRPTPFALGPWTAEHLHGGPVAALVARESQRCEPDERLRVARLTVELIRPVSLAPISFESRLVRPGHKVQLVEVIGRQDGIDVALGRALRIRTAEMGLPETARVSELPIPPPESGVVMVASGVPRAFHSEGAELRFVEGTFETPGPATVWVRLRVPILAGERPSPLERVAAAADFGNGVSSPLSFGDWLFINPDLTIHTSRLPVGEWVGLESRTSAESQGIGISESRLWDEEGPIGRSVQSLLIDRLTLG